MSKFVKTCYAAVGYIASLNVRTDYGTPAEHLETRDALSGPEGFKDNITVTAEEIAEAEAKHVLTGRQREYEGLKAEVGKPDLDGQAKPYFLDGTIKIRVKASEYADAKLACFEYAFMEGPKDKLQFKPVLYLGTTGNRRSRVYVDAMACQLLLARHRTGDSKLQPSADTVTDHINITVPDEGRFSAFDRLTRVLADNNGDRQGFKPMSFGENILAADRFVNELGCSQTDLRKEHFGNQGVRLFFIVTMDRYCRQQSKNMSLSVEERKLWAAVNLIGRLTAPKYLSDGDRVLDRVNANWLDETKFGQPTWQGKEDDPIHPVWGRRFTNQSTFLADNNKRKTLGQKQLTRPEAQECLDWVDRVAGVGAPKAKVAMKAAKMADLSASNPNAFVRLALLSASQNDPDMLVTANTRSDVANFVFSCKQEVYEAMERVVNGLSLLENDQIIGFLNDWNGMIPVVDVPTS